MQEVEVQRVSKASIASMVHLFEMLTQLKQNAANVEPMERQSFAPHQDLSVEVVDKVVNLVTVLQGERMAGENETRNKFQGLYQELRSSLLEAYDEVDRLTAAAEGKSAEEHWDQVNLNPYTLHPTPYTLHPTPYTLHPKP